MSPDTSEIVLHAPCPPKDGRPYRRIICAPEGKGMVFVALHCRILSHLMHWVGGRSYPCREILGNCEPCKQGQGARWEGFVGVVSIYTGEQFILKISAGAYRNCPALMELDAKRELNGKWLYCERMGEHKRRQAPAKITIVPPTKTVHLPPAFDIGAALARHWGLRSIFDLT